MNQLAYQTQEELKTYIIENIENGTWTPGSKLPSIRTLSERFELSFASTQRAVNSLKSEKIIEAKGGSGTFVPGDISKLRQRLKNNTILLAMPIQPAVEKLRDLALDRGMLLSYYSTGIDGQNPDIEKKLLEAAEQNNYQGVIMTPSPISPTNAELFLKLREQGIKVLLIGYYQTSMPEDNFLLPDFIDASKTAVIRGALLGYKHFIYAAHPKHVDTIHWQLFRQGYSEAIEQFSFDSLGELDISPDSGNWIDTKPTFNRLEEKIKDLPEKTLIVTPLYGKTDLIRDKIRYSGRSYPSDIGLILLNEIGTPEEVSCMHFDMNDLIEQALNYLADDSISSMEKFQKFFKAKFINLGTTIKETDNKSK